MSTDPGLHGQPDPPERATPSAWAYRGSIAALVVGSFLALFLVLRPPESKSQAELVRPAAPTAEPTATPEPTATAQPSTPTPAPPATPDPTPTPAAATPTPPPTPAATPTPTPAPAAFDYEIVSGDTLSDIAESFGTSVDAILDLNPGLDPNTLQIGQIILVPR
ncbi:MAG: LysM peptidoglycan-binding domain-containing protein [Dehalococcoidia bacterium]|nr:LysM peptidoglycan-binding domain-containing protein [Dehalococcoidia bacterium]